MESCHNLSYEPPMKRIVRELELQEQLLYNALNAMGFQDSKEKMKPQGYRKTVSICQRA